MTAGEEGLFFMAATGFEPWAGRLVRVISIEEFGWRVESLTRIQGEPMTVVVCRSQLLPADGRRFGLPAG